MLLKQLKFSAKFGIGHNISLQTFLQCIACGHEVCSKRKGEAPVSISPQKQICSFCHFTNSDTFQVHNTLDSVSWRQLCLIKRNRQIYLTEETKHLQRGESKFMMKITTEQLQDFPVGKLHFKGCLNSSFG